MSTTRGPLIDVKCSECRDTYALMDSGAVKSKLAVGVAHLFDPVANFVCRRCRQVQFAEAVELMLPEGPGAEASSQDRLTVEAHSLSLEEYALLFESQVRDLFNELVLRP